MFRRPLRTFPIVGILVLVFSSSAFANTYTVGPGSGTNFPDLPTAIAASQPGDVLLVQPAQYAGGFTLDKGLTIIGYGSVQVSGIGVVTHVPAGQRASIFHATLAGLAIDQCDGPILLGELQSTGPTTVTSSADVRFTSFTASLPPFPIATGVSVADSRVEISDSSIAGSNPYFSGYGSDNGGIGLDCGAGSRAHLTRSNVNGGGGEWNQGYNVYAGDGAPGIRTTNTSELILAGVGSSLIQAGAGGENVTYLDCCFDGDGANGIDNLHGGLIWYSGASLQGSPELLTNPCNCSNFNFSGIATGGGVTQVFPEDPALSVTGTFTPGSTSTLTLRGPVGSHAVLGLGRRVEVVPDPNTRIEILVAATKTFDLGVIPASGYVTLPVHDVSWAPGTFLAAQGTVTLPAGGIRRTNSIPMVFR